MSEPELVLRNAMVSRDDGRVRCDIVMAGGRIAGITAPGLFACHGAEQLDVAGRLVMPGLVDTHVHLGNGRQSVADDLFTETRMAAAGGVTTICPYLISPDGYDELLTGLADVVAERSSVDVFPQVGIVNRGQVADVARLYRTYGVRAFKCFMGYKGTEVSPSGIRGIDDGSILELMAEVAEIPGGRLAVHAENMEIIDAARERVRQGEHESLDSWTRARPRVAETEAIQRILQFATVTGCAVTIPHLSAGSDLPQLRRRARGVDVVFETCPHYLVLSADDDIGVWGKVNPPLRDEQEQAELWKGVASGAIDVLGSDHCPFDAEVKGAHGSIWEARAGIPNGCAVLLPMLLNRQQSDQTITDATIARVSSRNAAKRYALQGKGALALGADADLVVVDRDTETVFDSRSLGGVAVTSPYDGRRFHGSVWATLRAGTVVYREGVVQEPRRPARLLVDDQVKTNRGCK